MTDWGTERLAEALEKNFTLELLDLGWSVFEDFSICHSSYILAVYNCVACMTLRRTETQYSLVMRKATRSLETERAFCRR